MHLLRKVQTGFRVSVGADLLLLSEGLLALLLCAGPVGGLCSGRSLFADVEVTLSQGLGLFFAGRLGCSQGGVPLTVAQDPWPRCLVLSGGSQSVGPRESGTPHSPLRLGPTPWPSPQN